jgi:hypothetical protein
MLIRGNVHTPIFDFDNNEITISENTPLNTEIISLAAIDNDEGPDGEVLYVIADGEKQKFGIFPDGKVYLKEYLDRETKAYYAITVLAYDQGTPVRSSTATVVVYVADENDNSPILVSDNDVVYVDENSSPDTVVGRVSASDADIGRNAELTYTFANGMTSDNFLSVDSRTGNCFKTNFFLNWKSKMSSSIILIDKKNGFEAELQFIKVKILIKS